MGLEEALLSLGWNGIGRWQVITFLLICSFSHFPGMWQLYAIIFIGHTNPYRCRGKFDTNTSVPLEQNIYGQYELSKCLQYKTLDANETEPCTNWTVETDGFDADRGTIMLEWELVCDQEPLIMVSQIIFSVGVLLGFISLSPISDTFGRKPTMFFSLLLTSIFGAAMAFSPDFTWLCVFQFITGFFAANTYMTGFVIACELFPTYVRSITAPMTYVFEAFGIATLAGWAHFLRNWREFQFAISVASIPMIIYFWFCPESLRWLMANGQVEETQRWLEKAARFNKLELPPNILTTKFNFNAIEPGKVDKEEMVDTVGKTVKKNKVEKGDKANGVEMNGKAMESKGGARENMTLYRYLSHPKLLSYTGIMLYLWTTNNLIYFGISYLNAVLAGNRYLNFAMIGLLEILGIGCATVANQFVGRRPTLFVCHILAAIFLGCAAAIDALKVQHNIDPIYSTIFALMGKFATAGCTCTEAVYIQEIYPTNLRGTAVGLMMGTGFIGGIVAPVALFVANNSGIFIPLIVFAVMSLIGTALVLLLPETYMRDLPEDIHEVLSWPRAQTKQETASLKKMHQDRMTAKKETLRRQKEGKMADADEPAMKQAYVNPSFTTDSKNEMDYSHTHL